MIERLSQIRLLVVVCILLIGISAMYYGNRVHLTKMNTHVTFSTFPKHIGDWDFSRANTFSSEIEKNLGADAYIDYVYQSQEKPEMEVLVSYFSSMHEGKQFHSPKNCMLGSGWESMVNKEIFINWHGNQESINFMMVRMGSQILYVAYWVQGRGRLMSSEYEERIYRVIDSLIKRRSDGAFVRVSLPGRPEDRNHAEQLLMEFTKDLAVAVDNCLPM